MADAYLKPDLLQKYKTKNIAVSQLAKKVTGNESVSLMYLIYFSD